MAGSKFSDPPGAHDSFQWEHAGAVVFVAAAKADRLG
ncbi:hypothetical protein FHR81_004029 [Actinoalloteichus hoggarensis]|nr:hypothetical protein [Actinoalloteichus hoggarensis]